jgi:hypothetical protein
VFFHPPTVFFIFFSSSCIPPFLFLLPSLVCHFFLILLLSSLHILVFHFFIVFSRLVRKCPGPFSNYANLIFCLAQSFSFISTFCLCVYIFNLFYFIYWIAVLLIHYWFVL